MLAPPVLPDSESSNSIIEWEYSSEGYSTEEFSSLQSYVSKNDEATGSSDQLALLLVTGREQPVLRIPDITRGELGVFVTGYNTDFNSGATAWPDWQTRGRALHKWLIKPLEDDLERQDITSIGFVMDSVLRSLPTGALVNPKPLDNETEQDPDEPRFSLYGSR